MSSRSTTLDKCRFFGSDSLIYTYPIANDVCLPGLRPPECYGQQARLAGSILLQCDLLNTTYSTKFEYKDGGQNIITTRRENTPTTPIRPQECVASDYNSTEIDAILTYCQSIMHAFDQLVLDSITMGAYGTPRRGVDSKLPGVVFDSRIATTALMETEELAFVVDSNGVYQTFDTRQNVEANAFPSRSDVRTGRREDLKSALEMLFQNITMSLLSDEMLWPNDTSPYARNLESEVTFNTYHNVYVYAYATPWVAYGLAIFFTAIAMALGMLAIALNNGTYTNDFSTILRTSRAAEMSEEVREEERDGRQPLPRLLAKAQIIVDPDAGGKRSESSESCRQAMKEATMARMSLLSLRREPERDIGGDASST